MFSKSNKLFAVIYLTLLTFLVQPITVSAKSKITPLGYWTTISDKTKKPRAVVRLTQRNGIIEGRIIRIYPLEKDHDFCVKCPEPLKNKPIIGLRFLWGLKPDGELSWSGGHIIDPQEGSVYKCKMTLDKSGKTLFVRGYIGISLLGRTQLWVRRDKP